MSINWWGNTQNTHCVVFPHNGILFGHKMNDVLIPATVWFNPDNIKLNERPRDDHLLYDAIYMKFPEWVNSCGKKKHTNDCWGSVGGENWRLTYFSRMEFCYGMMKMFWNRWSWSLHNIMIVLSAIEMYTLEEELRCRRNRMGRPFSPLQIHWKNIWTLSKLHKTTSDR